MIQVTLFDCAVLFCNCVFYDVGYIVIIIIIIIIMYSTFLVVGMPNFTLSAASM